MAAGQPITVAVSIGDPLTGTIKGSTVVAAPSTGNNPINIDQVVSLATTPTGDQTIYASDIVYTKIQALGFVATLVTAGTGTASVTVKLKGCGHRGGRRDVYADALAGIAQRRGFCLASCGGCQQYHVDYLHAVGRWRRGGSHWQNLRHDLNRAYRFSELRITKGRDKWEQCLPAV